MSTAVQRERESTKRGEVEEGEGRGLDGESGRAGGGEVSSAWVFCVSRCADIEFRRPTIAVWTTHVGDRRLARAGLGRPGWVRDGRPEQRKARLQQAPWYGRAAAAAPLRIGISFGRMAAEARGKAVFLSLPSVGSIALIGFSVHH